MAQSEEAPLLAADPVVQTKTTRSHVILTCSVVGLVLVAKGTLRQETPAGAGAEEVRVASLSLAASPQPTPRAFPSLTASLQPTPTFAPTSMVSTSLAASLQPTPTFAPTVMVGTTNTPQPTGPTYAPTLRPTLNQHSNHYGDFKNTAFTNRSIGIYKRTHASSNAAVDVNWQQSVLGNRADLELNGLFGTVNFDDDVEGFPEAVCMKRSAGITAGNFSIHDVETERFHTGTYKPEVWWNYISRVHGPFTPYDFKGWNEFMVRSATHGSRRSPSPRARRRRRDHSLDAVVPSLVSSCVARNFRAAPAASTSPGARRAARAAVSLRRLVGAASGVLVWLLCARPHAPPAEVGAGPRVPPALLLPQPGRQQHGVRGARLQRPHGRGQRVPRGVRRHGVPLHRHTLGAFESYSYLLRGDILTTR